MVCRSLRPLVVSALLCACACTGANPALSSDDKHAMAARTQRVLPALRADGRSPLGTNLAAVRDYETAFAFVNLFKQSRVWISNTESTWDDGRPINVDAHAVFCVKDAVGEDIFARSRRFRSRASRDDRNEGKNYRIPH